MMMIYYDSIQEGMWFKGLHPILKSAALIPFPSVRTASSSLARLLSYDRPDVILFDGDAPILVVERTVEVPSGHNVGQRFARLVAAAQSQTAVVYFGPYAAYKHGGKTQGPRYMNLRLFYALKEMADIEKTAVTTINWPVDRSFEIVQDPSKDTRMIEYLRLFFDLYPKYGYEHVLQHLRDSDFQKEQEREQEAFTSRYVVSPEQYDGPPDSVAIISIQKANALYSNAFKGLAAKELVIYNVGMNYIRSDPYTGMGMLYSYLYCGGLSNRKRALIFHFPNISYAMWKVAASGRDRKDIRLFRLAADGIVFVDQYVPRAGL